MKGQRSIFTKKIEGIEAEISQASEEKAQLEVELNQLQQVSSKHDEIAALKEMIEKTQEEALKYKKQADGLAAQFSRVQAQLRRIRN